MGSLGDISFVVGRSEDFPEIADVRVRNNAEGITEVTIARDPKITEGRRYVVDRRVLPDSAWQRLLEVESFSDVSPNLLSEVKAHLTFESITNDWEIPFEKCWGLPEGMESPWVKPLEMIGNELLLTEDTKWVSGDAPVNIATDDYFENGKYGVDIRGDSIAFHVGNEIIGELAVNTSGLSWTDGVAGAAHMRGGSVWAEPAKPISFTGSFAIKGNTDIEYKLPGLYQFGDFFIVSSVALDGRAHNGTIAFIKDPFPERWVARMMGRAYVTLVSPANKPPFVEEEPDRISIRVEYPESDFPDLAPKAVTPYSDLTGVFNVWPVDENPVNATPRERPYDIYLPFDRLEDWGGLPVDALGSFFPALDYKGERGAAFPAPEGYTIPSTPEVPEGTIFYRWQDSAHFKVYEDENLDVDYHEGWVIFFSQTSPDASGIKDIQVQPGWNATKVEWTTDNLWVNDVEAFTEERMWEAVYTEEQTWMNVVGWSTESLWKPDVDIPLHIEQYEEIEPDWETGLPEGFADPPPPDYSERPRIWARVLFEGFEDLFSDDWTADTYLIDIADRDLKDFD